VTARDSEAIDAEALILPGIGNSGPGHWQSLWELAHPSFRRVAQRDWDDPEREEWVAILEATAAQAGPYVLLVAHSLGCLLVAHWAQHSTRPVRGALLVAVPNPSGDAFPAAGSSFGPVPLERLPFPSIVVASEDDPYGSLAYAQRCASAWGSRLVTIGPAGHINAASNLGMWPEGLELLELLATGDPVCTETARPRQHRPQPGK
jgi:predicted alpha/beta hydrolase family esterase